MAHGHDEGTKQMCLAMALDKHRLLAENDFSKLLNFVVADGQTLHIVFLLTYGAESARVLLNITMRWE